MTHPATKTTEIKYSIALLVVETDEKETRGFLSALE
jgi:hypothetical protein